MKRNFKVISKALSLLLALTMLLSVSSTVLASDAVENTQASMLSGEGMLGSSGGAASWMLEKLATGAVSAVGGKAMNAVLGSIFGSSSETDRFLTEINAVREDILNLQGQIGEMTALLIGKMNYGELKKDLDDFALYINQYVGTYNDLCNVQKLAKNDVELTEVFANDIYFGDDPNLWVDGKTPYNATIALGNRLVLLLQGGYNIFGAFDKMEKYANRWEHQGYADRKAFRDKILKIYSQYTAMCESACLIVRDTNLGNTAKENAVREMADIRLNQLRSNAEMVKKMNERCAVIEHPGFRIYRDTKTGANLYTFYITVRDTKMTALDYSVKIYYDERGYIVHEYLSADSYGRNPRKYMYSITDTSDPYIPPETFYGSNMAKGYNMYSFQPDLEDLQKIYQDYQSDYPGKTISMYDIFFDSKNGAFLNKTNRYGPTLGPGAWFATRYYYYSADKVTYRGSNESRWLSNFVNESGQAIYNYELGYFKDEWTVISTNPTFRVRLIDKSSRVADARYFSLTRWRGPDLEQGSLKAPSIPENQHDGLISGMADSYELPYTDSVTLSVSQDLGISYQWYLDKGDDSEDVEIEGATGAVYTLPALQADMNGWSYSCAVIEDNNPEEGKYFITHSVTLKLTGEGIPAPVTEHEVSNSEELSDALDKVTDGSWSGHTVKLTADIAYPTPISLIDNSMTIDLNGHTLTVQPSSDSGPNINPMSNMAKTAAIYSLRGNLYLKGDGALNVIAGQGIDYGVYAYASEVKVSNITCTDGGTSVYATDGGSVEITGDVSAKGENTYAIECFGGSTVKVSGNMSAEGHTSCGVYAESYTGQEALVEVGGDVIVSGDNSQAAFLNADYTVLKVQGNVTVTGAGASGISAGGGEADNRCTAIIYGDINAPMDAVNAWDSADVRVHGNVTVTDEGATAVSAVGAMVQLHGNVTYKGKDGTGISVSAWDLVDPVVVAMVKADGKITAFTPLRMKGMPVEESEHSDESVYAGYYAFTDGTNTVWAKPGSFVKTIDSDPDFESDPDSVSNPQTGESTNSALWVMLGISALAIIVIQAIVVKRRKEMQF